MILSTCCDNEPPLFLTLASSEFYAINCLGMVKMFRNPSKGVQTFCFRIEPKEFNFSSLQADCDEVPLLIESPISEGNCGYSILELFIQDQGPLYLRTFIDLPDLYFFISGSCSDKGTIMTEGDAPDNS